MRGQGQILKCVAKGNSFSDPCGMETLSGFCPMTKTDRFRTMTAISTGGSVAVGKR